MVGNVTLLSLSEEQLFQLPEACDDLLASNEAFQADGVFKFQVQSKSGGGTSIQDIFSKFGDDIYKNLKKLNPISNPRSKGLYGHLQLEQPLVDEDHLQECKATTQDLASYIVSDCGNCCMTQLSTAGESGLLAHFFDNELPTNSKKAPQSIKPRKKANMVSSARAKGRAFNHLQQDLHNMNSNQEKALKLKDVLSKRKKEEPALCECDMCYYSDEKLGEDGMPCAAFTAKYFREKGFMYGSDVNVPSKLHNMISENFSLAFLSLLSISSLLDQSFPGISTAYLYFGFLHSFFPVHIENLSLWSINFLHHGFPKVWIVIPPSAVAKLSYMLGAAITNPGHGRCMARLTHKYHLPTTSWLQRHGIPYKVVLQWAGEGVVLAPNAAHFGFNAGPNIAESINFASKFWIPYGIVSPKCECILGQIHGDLSTIISLYNPDMRQAYHENKIPTVLDQKYFPSTIIHPSAWKESFCSGSPSQDDSTSDGGDDTDKEHDTDEEDETNETILQLNVKKGPNRKIISCPVCDKVYEGGQKRRLLHHFNTIHADLSQDKYTAAQEKLTAVFPPRDKMPKKKCALCGKLVARSMKSHQASSACIPKL